MNRNPGAKPRRLVVGITGASGAILGVRLLEMLKPLGVESHLVLTPAARATIGQETDRKVSEVVALADVAYNPQDVGAAIASGSFPTLGMVVIPCSIKSLSAIANCYAEDLLTRAADVTLKEGRPLLLAVRETALHLNHLRLMVRAAEAGAVTSRRCRRSMRGPPVSTSWSPRPSPGCWHGSGSTTTTMSNGAECRASRRAASSPQPISRSSVSSRSASAAGLSQRMRWMRGKRMATPDLCRVERCADSNATSSTSAGVDLAHRPVALGGVVAHPAVELAAVPRR